MFYFMYVHVYVPCLPVCAQCVCSAHRGQKKLDALEL